jgi:tRNA U34 5-carboxymethylaminomethyl modifying GTPase MnmE/TrmE
MISPPLVAEANAVRKAFLEAVTEMDRLPTLRAMESTSEALHAELEAARELIVSGKLRQPFSAAFACAVVGSSNHGKTSILAEMFPDLKQRGWLVTDVKDTTSQALVIRQPGPRTDPHTVIVHSWDEG